jgi:hypothetical protein
MQGVEHLAFEAAVVAAQGHVALFGDGQCQFAATTVADGALRYEPFRASWPAVLEVSQLYGGLDVVIGDDARP